MNPFLDGFGKVIPSRDTSEPPTGGGLTVKGDEVVPPVVVTTTFPAATGALAGTDVVIEVALPVVTVAGTPPMVTVAPLRPVPVMVTPVPAEPDAGETSVMTGAAAVGADVTVNANDAAGATVVLATMKPAPTIALPGTVVFSCWPVLFVTSAAAPPMVIMAPARLVPLIVTAAPGAPLGTETLVMVGGKVGGGKTIAVPHPPVWMFRAPPL